MNWLKDKIEERIKQYEFENDKIYYDENRQQRLLEAREILSLIDQAVCEYTLVDEDRNLWKCSNCSYEGIINKGGPKDNGIKYCPHCGFEIK